MTAAGTIEVGAIGHAEPMKGLGAGWKDASAAGRISVPQPAAESFQSNWKAQLASLGSGTDAALDEPSSVEETGAELINAARPKSGPGAVNGQLAGQTFPVRAAVAKGLAGSTQRGIELAGNARPVLPAHENGGAKAAISKTDDSRAPSTLHRAAKSGAEKTAIAASPGLVSTASAIQVSSSSVDAIPTGPVAVVNRAQADAKPAESKIVSNGTGTSALHESSAVAPWTSLSTAPKSSANGEVVHLGTVAELPKGPSWTASGSEAPPLSSNPMPNRGAEPARVLDTPRIEPGAGDSARTTAFEGNPAVGPMDAAATQAIKATKPVEDSRPAEQTSQPARMAALPGASDGAGQATAATAGAGTGTEMNSKMNSRVTADGQSNRLQGPIPNSLSASIQPLAPIPLVAELPRANPGPAEAIKSGARLTVTGAAHGIAAQTPATTLADANSWMRVPAGILQPQAGASDNSFPGTAEPALRETFAALDAEAMPAALSWTHAGARQAEAGFQDPVLGWVGVRAELSGGGVHAALLPGSADAAEQLGRQMDGLHTYLADQRTPVDSLVMAAPAGGNAHAGAGGGFGHSTQHEMGRGTGQETGHGAGQNAREQATGEPESIAALGRSGAGRAPASQAPAGAGIDGYSPSNRDSHISLIA